MKKLRHATDFVPQGHKCSPLRKNQEKRRPILINQKEIKVCNGIYKCLGSDILLIEPELTHQNRLFCKYATSRQ